MMAHKESIVLKLTFCLIFFVGKLGIDFALFLVGRIPFFFFIKQRKAAEEKVAEISISVL